MNLIYLRAATAVWTPARLFAASEVGVWYDPSDLTTMWTDVARTTQVTTDGDLVACIDDKSGNGFHATQSSSGNRPAYKTSGGLHWLAFDGTDDSLSTSAVDFSGTDKITAFLGLRKLSGASEKTFLEHGVPGTHSNANTILAAPGNSGDGYADFASSLRPYGGNKAAGSSPITVVATITQDAASGGTGTDNVRIRLNGSLQAKDAYFSGSSTAALGNYSLYIGRRNNASLPFDGRMYGLILRGAVSTSDEITAAEAWMNGKTAAY